jgi:hypothetical protein
MGVNLNKYFNYIVFIIYIFLNILIDNIILHTIINLIIYVIIIKFILRVIITVCVFFLLIIFLYFFIINISILYTYPSLILVQTIIIIKYNNEVQFHRCSNGEQISEPLSDENRVHTGSEALNLRSSKLVVLKN